jgi:hypothetical protein
MTTETDTTTVVNDTLPHLAVTVAGHVIRRGEPTELPTELAERLIADNVGWQRADSAGQQDAAGPFDGLKLDDLRNELAARGIDEPDGRLTRAAAIDLLTAADAQAPAD